MGKLLFYYGVMSSANLLMSLHNAKERGDSVRLMKPSVDHRDGHDIRSRVGLSCTCDYLLGEEDVITPEMCAGVDIVYLDECQFLTVHQVESLRHLPCTVLCYGLKTDYRTRLFPASQRLLELADSIQEVKTRCGSQGCHNKATVTAKLVYSEPGGPLRVLRDGDAAPDIGDLELSNVGRQYKIFCYACFARLPQ